MGNVLVLSPGSSRENLTEQERSLSAGKRGVLGLLESEQMCDEEDKLIRTPDRIGESRARRGYKAN